MNKTVKSSFTNDFIRLNHLDAIGFVRWVFQAGMEFETHGKWWEETGSRSAPHEGLDFCCFENREGQTVYLPENTLVPVMYDGTVVRIFTDFLGESILVEHDFQHTGRNLYSIYAHTVPDKGLQAGSRVKSGEPICATCPSKNRSMSSHLHLTVLRAPEEKIASLGWSNINQTDHVILCDPLDFICR